MRNLVLILAIAAMVYGGKTYCDRNPDVVEKSKELVAAVLGKEVGADEEEDDQEESGSAKKSAGPAVSMISRGQKVDIAAHASKSGRTIVEFTADW